MKCYDFNTWYRYHITIDESFITKSIIDAYICFWWRHIYKHSSLSIIDRESYWFGSYFIRCTFVTSSWFFSRSPIAFMQLPYPISLAQGVPNVSGLKLSYCGYQKDLNRCKTSPRKVQFTHCHVFRRLECHLILHHERILASLGYSVWGYIYISSLICQKKKVRQESAVDQISISLCVHINSWRANGFDVCIKSGLVSDAMLALCQINCYVSLGNSPMCSW